MTDEEELVPVSPVSTFQRTSRSVTEGLTAVRAELAAKRERRDQLNDQIRQLVADEALLARMARIAAVESTNGDGHEPHP